MVQKTFLTLELKLIKTEKTNLQKPRDPKLIEKSLFAIFFKPKSSLQLLRACPHQKKNSMKVKEESSLL